jgi:hypothetical protein
MSRQHHRHVSCHIMSPTRVAPHYCWSGLLNHSLPTPTLPVWCSHLSAHCQRPSPPPSQLLLTLSSPFPILDCAALSPPHPKPVCYLFSSSIALLTLFCPFSISDRAFLTLFPFPVCALPLPHIRFCVPDLVLPLSHSWSVRCPFPTCFPFPDCVLPLPHLRLCVPEFVLPLSHS